MANHARVRAPGLRGEHLVRFAPAGTPRAVLDRLHTEIAAILQQTDIRRQITAQGSDAVGNTAEQFREVMEADHQRLGRLIRASGIKIE